MNTPRFHRTGLIITLLEPLVFSARNATIGGHETLQYIPGSALLGLAAQRLYQTLPEAQSWSYFHSGAVRFGDGLPLTDEGTVARPIPASLVRPKGKSFKTLVGTNGDEKLDIETVRNASFPGALHKNIQYEPIRGYFITDDLRLVQVKLVDTLKTAIDPATGSAKEAMLFDLQAIAADQRFFATIEADADRVEVGEFEKIIASLLETGGARLGRSRSAEFGRVNICRADAPVLAETKPADTATVWLLSDFCICGRDGRHNSSPLSEAQFSGWEIVRERSFITWKSYTPFNGRWGINTTERTVAAAGSVLTLKRVAESSISAQDALQQYAIGRETGFGCFEINPAILSRASPSPVKQHVVKARTSVNSAIADRPPGDFGAWLSNAASKGDTNRKIDQFNTNLFVELEQNYARARILAGVGPEQIVGPGKSQWQKVAMAANRCSSVEGIRHALFDAETPLIPETDLDWGVQFAPTQTFRFWLWERIGEYYTDDQVAYGLAQFAEGAIRILRQKKGGR